jgi:hypothetical protein
LVEFITHPADEFPAYTSAAFIEKHNPAKCLLKRLPIFVAGNIVNIIMLNGGAGQLIPARFCVQKCDLPAKNGL